MRPLSILSLTLALAFAPAAAAVEIFPLEEVRPGMQGVAYTVFQGDSIAAFPVEIVDRVPGRGPFELVLIRGESELIERGGVSQGMSGSPVYIDGRLLGALAYNFNYAREPMAFVTPIAAMLALADQGTDRRADAGGQDRLPFLSGDAQAADLGSTTNYRLANEALRGPADPPLTLGVSGLDPPALAGLGDAFAAQGLSFVPLGATATGASTGEPRIAPGAAVAVELLRGPIQAAATGTLTYLDGKRFWAFGHPFLDEGAVDLPLAAARVHGTMPSLINSFKIASVGAPIGRILRDGRAGIFGELGSAPAMLPLRVRLRRENAADREAQFQVARHPRLLGSMVRLAIQGWLSGPMAMQDKGGIAIRLIIYPRGGEPVAIEQHFAGEGVFGPPGIWAKSIVDALQRNPAGPLAVDSLSLDLEWRHGVEPIHLVGISVERSAIAADEAWNLSARFRRGGREFSRRFTVPATETRRLPSGDYQLHFADGMSYQRWDAARQPGLYRFENHARLLAVLGRLEPGGNWLLWLSQAGERSVIGGREFDLPVWFRELMPAVPKRKNDEKRERRLPRDPRRIAAASETRGYQSIPVTILPSPLRSEP